MNTKTKEGARHKGNPYFLRVPWNKRGLVNTGPYVFDKGIPTLACKLSASQWYLPGYIYGMLITEQNLVLHLRIYLGRD